MWCLYVAEVSVSGGSTGNKYTHSNVPRNMFIFQLYLPSFSHHCAGNSRDIGVSFRQCFTVLARGKKVKAGVPECTECGDA